MLAMEEELLNGSADFFSDAEKSAQYQGNAMDMSRMTSASTDDIASGRSFVIFHCYFNLGKKTSDQNALYTPSLP